MSHAMPIQWRKGPGPDASVVAFTGTLAQAAQDGQVHFIAVVTGNRNLEIEYVHAGELDETRKNLLIGGLNRLIRKLSE
jgi:hypothetical protein